MKPHERVNTWLEEHGLAQRELADKIGVTEVTMARFLSGQRLLKGPYLCNLAKVMGIPVEELMAEYTQTAKKDDLISRQYLLTEYDRQHQGPSGGARKIIEEAPAVQPEHYVNIMDEKALKIVRDYILEHLDKSDSETTFEVFTVWKAKTLQNWKYLISSTLSDGMYYELTFNGDKDEWYLDAYKKFENRVVEE